MSSMEQSLRFDSVGVSRITPPSPTSTAPEDQLFTSGSSPECRDGSSRSGSATEMDLPNMDRGGASASPLLSGDLLEGTLGTETDCPYCHKQFRQPRVLKCLHSLCEDCVIALLEGRREEDTSSELECELEPSSTPELKPPPGVLRCPVCKEDSQIGNDASFVRQMLVDFVTVNLQDAEALLKDGIHCESCKTKDAAIARCHDCCSFLCKNCVQAHQFMRCFEGHQVVTLEEMKESNCGGDGILVHRSINCPVHPNEQLRFFCITDDSPACNECLLTIHKHPEHKTIHTDDPACDKHLKNELNELVSLGRSKEKFCEETGNNFSTYLSTLNESRKIAQEQLDLAFDRFKELLEIRRNQLVQELDQVCLEQEQRINSGAKTLGSLSEKLSDACRFGERLSTYGTAMEIFVSRKTVLQQLTSLARKAQSPDVSVSLRFAYNDGQFEQALQSFCGGFKTEEAMTPVSMTSNRDFSDIFQRIPNEDLNRLVKEPPPSNGMPPFVQKYAPNVAAQNFSQRSYPPPSYSNPRTQFDIAPSAYANTPAKTPQPDAYTANLMAMINLGGGGDAPPIRGSTNSFGNQNFANLSSFAPGARPASRTETRTNSAASSHSPPSINTNYPHSSFGLLPHTIPGPSQYSLFNPPPSGRVSTTPLDSSGWGLPPPSVQPSGNGLGPQHPVGKAPGQGLQMSLDGAQGVVAAGLDSCASNIPPARPNKMPSMEIKCKFGSLGPGQSQFNSPHGFCLGFDDEIVVADTNNHRIQVFSKDGVFIHQFGVAGKEDGQMWYPRKVTVMNGYMQRYVVCDRGMDRSRMQIFTRQGEFIKKIAIRYIDIVAGLCVDKEGYIVAVDSVSPTVFRISETGELSKWFDCSEHMKEPSDIAVANGNYYICDFKGHCVCVFGPEGEFVRKIGCEQMTSFPNGIDISDMGDVLIGDSHGNRFHVAIFKSDGVFQTEFECPFVKVSRCCGLRITSEGLIVTLAKNNHHLLVLNTLYVN